MLNYYAVKLVLLRRCNQNYVQILVLDQNVFIWKDHFKVFFFSQTIYTVEIITFDPC